MQAVRICHISPPAPAPSTSPTLSHPGSAAFGFTVQHVDVDVRAEDEKLHKEEIEKGDRDGEEEKQKGKGKRDPLRMFGILTPQSLRTAQKDAIEMVKVIIPKLVSIDAEMKEVEIQVRRARKFRGKAEGVEMKDGERKDVLVDR